MKENVETVKMTGTVSNDCRPLAVELRKALVKVTKVLRAKSNGEYTTQVDVDTALRTASDVLANTESL